MGALVFGVEPEAELVTLDGEALAEVMLEGTRRDTREALTGLSEHLGLQFVHLGSPPESRTRLTA